MDELKRFIEVGQFREAVEQHVMRGEPVAFRNQPELHRQLRSHLGRALGVADDCIVVVGSAKVGFSLNPDRFGQPFSEYSDIDIVVISEGLFDSLWLVLVDWYYPYRIGRTALPAGQQTWASERRKNVFLGWFEPTRMQYDGLSRPEVLNPLRDFSALWFNAFQSLSLSWEFAGRGVSGRLFRTWSHAVRYYADGLRQVREALNLQQTGG